MGKYFGTDGFRGEANVNLTVDHAFKVGRFLGWYYGRDEVSMERFDIVSLIRGVLQSMDIMIQQKEAKVSFEASEPVYVWADEFKIEEVVTNYTSNALNHLNGEKEIEIRVIPEDDRVRVTVFNTGTPIPEEDVPKLWNKFYKVDKARTRSNGKSRKARSSAPRPLTICMRRR